MAVDITAVCASADANQGSQTLAVVLSIMFSIYTVVAIILSALTIYSTSQAPPNAVTRALGERVTVTTGDSAAAGDDHLKSVPLLGFGGR